MSETYEITDDDVNDVAGALWDLEDRLRAISPEAEAAVAPFHQLLKSKADDLGIPIPQQRGGTPKGENPPPPPPPGG